MRCLRMLSIGGQVKLFLHGHCKVYKIQSRFKFVGWVGGPKAIERISQSSSETCKMGRLIQFGLEIPRK